MAIGGTALVFSLVLIMSGLSIQFRREARDTVDRVGADKWVVAQGVTGPFTAGADTVPETLADELTAKGAKQAAPAVIARKTIEGREDDVMILGVGSGWNVKLAMASGVAMPKPGETVASAEAALQIGSRVQFKSTVLKVVGIAKSLTVFGGTPILFMGIRDAQGIVFRGQPVASTVLIRGDVATSEQYRIMSPDHVGDDALRLLEKPVAAIDLVQLLLWIVATAIISVVVYISALERVRDFAVFKAVGASSRDLLSALTTQSILVALLAAGLAVGIAAGLIPLFPIPISVPARAYIQLPIFALFAGALASAGGIRKVLSIDPALAFAGP
jgi:putative ABC transport system permease protein